MRPSPLCNLLTEDEAADLLRISPRTLRSIRAAGNLKAVSRLLDHTDVTTTAKYAHALEDDIRAMLLATETGQGVVEGPEKKDAQSA